MDVGTVEWVQAYDPLGSWPLSTLVAALPVLVLLGLLASGKAGAWQAALAGLLTALVVAIGPFHMPARLALAAVGVGAAFAAFRVVWLIVAALFLYDITVATGQFDIMKRSIAQISGDRRIQAVLVAFSFGAFIEGAAGFGAPVAISAAFLVGLGFRPLQAAVICLIANTAPVAWGSVGVPVRTLAQITGLDVEAISATSGRILPPLSLLVPFWLVAVLSGIRGTVAVWPALLAVGGTFAAVQFAWSNGAAVFGLGFTSFELVDIVAAIASLLAGVILLRFWRPGREWRFDHDADAVAPGTQGLTARQVARAWMPFVILSLAVTLWGVPAVKKWMAAPHALGTSGRAVRLEWHPHTRILPTVRLRRTSGYVVRLEWHPPMPGLDRVVARGRAVIGHDPTPADREEAKLDLVPVSATGTAVFLAAILSGLVLGVGPVRQARILGATVWRLVPAIGAILCMLALGFVTKYAGTDAVLGLAFTRAGASLYPLFGTLLGWLGVALTGSDTSSNVLFGNLQKITATKLGLSPILMTAANTTGGVMGKMIAAQSIVVAAAATGETGHESKILRAVVGHSLALAFLVGLIVWAYAHVWPGLVVTASAP
jgi:lactate permease